MAETYHTCSQNKDSFLQSRALLPLLLLSAEHFAIPDTHFRPIRPKLLMARSGPEPGPPGWAVE